MPDALYATRVVREEKGREACLRRACRTIRTSPSGRWRIEEAIRFGKQSYGLEDIRAPARERQRNTAVLVSAAAFFTALVLETRIKLDILATHLPEASARSAPEPPGVRYPAPTLRPSLHSPSVEIFGECPGNLMIDNAASLCDYIKNK